MSIVNPNAEHLIGLSPADKKLLRFDRVVIENRATPLELRNLAQEILAEPVVHAWKHLVAANKKFNSDHISAFENERRLTEVFYYFGENGSTERELVGIACIAHKIRMESSLLGFPVIGQSYVKKAYRNFRLYFPLLAHRINYCQALREKTKGILMCSQNPRIFNSIKQGSFGYSFKYLGEEDLPLRDGLNRLRHFMLLNSDFEKALRDFAAATFNLGSGFVELGQTLHTFLDNGFTNSSHGRLKALISRLEAYPNWKKLDLSGFIELLAVMDAIPILEDSHAEEKTFIGRVTIGRTG